MVKKILTVLTLLPLTLLSQVDQSLQWAEGLSWPDIVAKAKMEEKVIFVDCYATWCGPCKEMDAQVYVNPRVTSLLNNKFLCVKIQMDSTSNDPISARKLFSTAKEFEKLYKINSLPTFLFFSPEGSPLHKDQGKKNVPEFLALLGDAMDSSRQIYSIVERYKKRIYNYKELPRIIKTLKEMNEETIANEIARDYISHYLENLPEVDYLTFDNMRFIRDNAIVLRESDRIFKICLQNPAGIDTALGEKRFAKTLSEFVIYKDVIQPYLLNSKETGKEPNWKHIAQKLRTTYVKNEYFNPLLDAQISWSKYRKNWSNYTKYLYKKMRSGAFAEYGKEKNILVAFINNKAAELLTYSNRRRELKVGIEWVNYAISAYGTGESLPTLLDTKANLLYKMGKRQLALATCKEAAERFPEYCVFYKCMEAGLPTWLDIIWSRKLEKKKEVAKAFQDKVKHDLEQYNNDLHHQVYLDSNQRRDLSGIWKLNVFKSTFNTLPGYVASKKLIIFQNSDSMQIERFNTDENDAQIYSKEKFSLDWAPASFIIENGLTKKVVTASWVNDTQMLETLTVVKPINNSDKTQVRRLQKWSLWNRDPNILIVDQLTEIDGNPKPYSIKAVYERERTSYTLGENK